jgi:hypothetical protein
METTEKPKFKIVEEYLIEKFDGDIQNRETLQEVILVKDNKIVLQWQKPSQSG